MREFRWGLCVFLYMLHIDDQNINLGFSLGFRVEVKFGSKWRLESVFGLGCSWAGEGQELLIVSCLWKSSQSQKYKKVCVAWRVRRAGPALFFLSFICRAQREQKQVLTHLFANSSSSLALTVTSPGPPGPHVCAVLSPRSALLPQPVAIRECFWWNPIHCVTWVGHTRFALRERAKY